MFRCSYTASIAPLLLLVAIGLSSCSQEITTFSMAEAREYVTSPQSMFRGIDYLGTKDGLHYFEYKREMARDSRFRIPQGEYSPKCTVEYSPWFPTRTDVYAEFTTPKN